MKFEYYIFKNSLFKIFKSSKPKPKNDNYEIDEFTKKSNSLICKYAIPVAVIFTIIYIIGLMWALVTGKLS